MISNTNACTSCEQNNVDNITEGITSMNVLADMTECFNCGKEGNSDEMNTCNKCNMAKYCNVACKKKHRKKHKKACEKHVAELHEEALFKDPFPLEECPICMLTLPQKSNTVTFESCCGKRICNGCIYAMKMSEGKNLCAFCRTRPPTSDQEELKRLKNLMDKGNAQAFFTCGNHFYCGDILGLPQDHQKANDLWLKAGELGCAAAYCNLGLSYDDGYGVERNTKKAIHYWELAAMGGDTTARNNLGVEDHNAGNYQRSMRSTL